MRQVVPDNLSHRKAFCILRIEHVDARRVLMRLKLLEMKRLVRELLLLMATATGMTRAGNA